MSKEGTTVVKKKKSSKKLVMVGLALLPTVLSLAAAGYYYTKFQDLNKMTAEQFSQRENKAVLEAVSKLYSLPKDEEPSIASVKDKEALVKQNTFFEGAENGDVVIIYSKAKTAIIYRPASKQLVKVGPVNVQDDLRIKVAGTASEKQAVTKLLADSKITATDGGTTKGTYLGITVVDLSGKNQEQAKKVAETIKGQVGSLPNGEDKPTDVDILIIVGPAVAAAPVQPEVAQ